MRDRIEVLLSIACTMRGVGVISDKISVRRPLSEHEARRNHELWLKIFKIVVDHGLTGNISARVRFLNKRTVLRQLSSWEKMKRAFGSIVKETDTIIDTVSLSNALLEPNSADLLSGRVRICLDEVGVKELARNNMKAMKWLLPKMKYSYYRDLEAGQILSIDLSEAYRNSK